MGKNQVAHVLEVRHALEHESARSAEDFGELFGCANNRLRSGYPGINPRLCLRNPAGIGRKGSSHHEHVGDIAIGLFGLGEEVIADASADLFQMRGTCGALLGGTLGELGGWEGVT